MLFTNVPAFTHGLRQLAQRIDTQLQAAVQTLGERGAELAKETTLFHNQGPLRQATQFRRTQDFQGIVIADKPYAYWLEAGNNQQGSVIRPKFAKALHFKVAGQEVFAKSVKAHGPLPFMDNARNQLEKEANQIIQQHLAAALR